MLRADKRPHFCLFHNGIRTFIYLDTYVVKNAFAADESCAEVERARAFVVKDLP